MPNNTTFLDNANYSNVFMRQVIIGFLGFLRGKFSWTNYSNENGPYDVNMPIYYSLTGDNRYIMDAFYDDMSDTRVEMNTDIIPRGVVTLKSWAVKSDEFTNPNVWVNFNQIIDDELQQIVTQIKAVPVKLTFELQTILDTEIDIFKCWQTYMDNMYIYKYFVFDYNRIPINAVFNFISDTENSAVREYKLSDINTYQSTYSFEIHTFYPILDIKNEILANNEVQWILQIWQKTSNPIYPTGGIN